MKKIIHRFIRTGAEYQVKDGRKVIGRFDTLKQAMTAHPDAKIDC